MLRGNRKTRRPQSIHRDWNGNKLTPYTLTIKSSLTPSCSSIRLRRRKREHMASLPHIYARGFHLIKRSGEDKEKITTIIIAPGYGESRVKCYKPLRKQRQMNVQSQPHGEAGQASISSNVALLPRPLPNLSR